MQTVNKHSVLKEVREKGAWEGFIAPNNARVGTPWKLEMEILITVGRDGKYYVVNRYNNSPITVEYEELETTLNSFMYYQPRELGTRVRFWK